MSTRKKIFTQWVFFYFVIPLVILWIGRVAFFLYYYSLYKDYSFGDIFLNLLHGIRFDLSLVGFLYGSFFLFLLFLPKSWQIAGVKILTFCTLPISLALIFMQIVGIGYFQESGRHLSFEIFFLLSDFPALTRIALQEFKILVALGLFLLGIFVVLFFRLFFSLSKKKIASSFSKKITFFFVSKDIIKRIAIFLLIVLCARGGWQLKPLSVTHAFYHGDQQLGSLAFGAPFSLVKFLGSLTKPVVFEQWIPDKIAHKVTQKLLAADKYDIFLSEDYPFYRKLDATFKKPTKKNLVVIVMESWGSNYLTTLGEKNYETTPYFNKLLQQGAFFENFFAVGSRSIQGVSSIMFGLPSIEKLPIYKAPFATNRMISLPVVLGKEGYESIFFHAGHEGSLYLHNLARIAKYKKAFSLDNLQNSKEKYDGTWGFWDHFAFLDFAKELNKLQPPFHGMFFSLTSHAPYALPSKEFEYFKEDIPDYQFLNSLRYSDWSLQQFFAQAKKYDWYKDTIFFIVADHNRGISKNQKNTFRIPLLVFSPEGEIPQGKFSTIGSQIDILPTALSLLAVHSPFAAAGKDLFRINSSESYALVSTNVHHWFTPEYIYTFDDNILQQVYSFSNTKQIKGNLQEEIHQKNINHFLSYFQTSFRVILDNKITPSP